MSTPGLPGPPPVPNLIPPRQPGETVYAYRNRRSVALTGETLYQRRIRSGRARGLSTTEARGQRPGESRRRYERVYAQTGLTPWQIFRDTQLAWLVDNGYTPETTGWSWNRLIRVAPRLRYMVDNSSPGGIITPGMIAEAEQLQAQGVLDPEWTWENVNEKYLAVYEYNEYRDNTRGRWRWFNERIEDMPVAWWFYHP